MEERFNLIDEDWIPVVGHGRVSLSAIFSNSSLPSLGGNCLQKISVLKLLLAIAQSACTPQNDEEWKELGTEGLAQRCNKYLEKHREAFYLYGSRPFLQMPAVKDAKLRNFGAVLPELPSENTTIVFQNQVEQEISDSDKALILLQANVFAITGNQLNNPTVLTAGYTRAKKAGVPGPGLGALGYQHCFYWGEGVQETVFMNVLTQENIGRMKMFEQGLGQAPWEVMPSGEDDEIAQKLRNSYTGRLVPLSRFILLSGEQLHCIEGIVHPDYKEGAWDPSISVLKGEKDTKVLWINPSKRPWRSLPSILEFLRDPSKSYLTHQISEPYTRIIDTFESFGVYAGGIRVSSNAGNQYCTGRDDYVESLFHFKSRWIREADWFVRLKQEMDNLEKYSKILYACISAYNKALKVDNKDAVALALGRFWSLCEGQFQNLIYACAGQGAETVDSVRKLCFRYCVQVYNQNCPNSSARQMQAWAKNLPGNKSTKGDTND